MRVIAIIAVLVLVHVAHADSPVVASAGLGFAIGKVDVTSPYDSPQLGVGAHLDVLGRVLPELGLGIRAAISRVPHVNGHYEPDQPPVDYSFMFYAIDVGITVHYTIDDRVWLAPWIGLEDGVPDGYVNSRESIAYGVEVGGDLSRNGRQRIGAFASLSQSHFDSAYGNLDAFTCALVGIAYRYW